MAMDDVIKEDVENFVKTFPVDEFGPQLRNATFLITGATGLIGSSLIYCLLALKQNIRVIAPVRNKAKALSMLTCASQIELIECDLTSFNYESLGNVDYIVHCAAPTSSIFFVEKPVETFNIIMQGTSALLDYARKRKLKGFVYLSSLEVYGENGDESVLMDESFQGYLNPISVRSSYPMAKRATENLCHLYAKEYEVPVKIARLTQTTGAGIAKDDNRVIAQFARLALNGLDIVLHTKGESARPYCYTMDSVSAILFILFKGKTGDVYNVANESTYISARGLAEYLKENFNPVINVKVEVNENMGYAPVTKQRLSSKKLEELGWCPQYGLNEIFKRLCLYFKNK